MKIESGLRRQRRFLPLLLALLLLTACSNPLAPAASDTDAVVEQVLNRLEERTATSGARVTVAAPAQQTLTVDTYLESQLIDLYQRANPAVVYIATSTGSGSGFLYDAAGHIVTNNHVVAGVRAIEVAFGNGERRAARIVGVDADSDLAVLAVDSLPAGVAPLPLAAADDIQVGQFVVAIGSPFGEQGSMTLGIVSGLGRSLTSQRSSTGGAYSLPSVIQTDAPINPGNSGGPLLNLRGEVVGVNSAIASTSGANTGVGFSIPVAALHQIVPALIERGAYSYPYLGVSFDDEISLGEQAAYGLEQAQGVYILAVAASGPAAQAGLIAANPTSGRGGDLIVAIDGRAVNNFQELNSYLVFHTQAGQTIQLTVVRSGSTVTIPLTLGTRP
jgi:2-alkenal reductase